MGHSSDNPALQLFHLELQELLEQVGQSLTALVDSPSAFNFKRLCRSVRLIHQGAVQMKLRGMEQRTTAFLKILLPDSNVPEGDLSSSQINALTQLFRELQTLDFISSAGLPEVCADGNASLDADFGLDESSILDEFNDVAASSSVIEGRALQAPSSSAMVSRDLRQVLLQNDIAEVITQLAHSVETLTGESLVSDLNRRVDSLLGWGEVLDWPALVTITQAIAQGVKAHPDAAQAITSVGVLGLQSLHQSALRAWESKSDGNESELMSFSLTKTETQGQTISPAPFVFETARKFIWQYQQAVFSLDSAVIAETLIPLQTQVISHDGQKLLQWHDQRVAMVSLIHLLTQQWSLDLGINPIPSSTAESVAASSVPVIVIATEYGTVALEIEMEQFIRTRELVVTPTAAAPAFFLGRTSVPDSQDLQLIDVLELLACQPNALVPNDQEGIRVSSSVPKEGDDGLISNPHDATRAPVISVLVVDDSRTIRYLLQRMFEKAGYFVVQAHDGLDAIHQLQQHPEIALMVSDVEMPNLTGFELLNRCRRHSEWQNLPIIILSQCSTDQHQQLALQFGADAYLPKPFNDETFLTTVESVLRI